MSNHKAEFTACSEAYSTNSIARDQNGSDIPMQATGLWSLEVNLRFDFRLFPMSFGKTEFFVKMSGHPQSTVVLVPCSIPNQMFPEATMGIISCASSLFVCRFGVCLCCSTERSERGECCIYGSNLPGVWLLGFSLGDADFPLR